MFIATLHLLYLYCWQTIYNLPTTFTRRTEPEYDCTIYIREGRNALSSSCFLVIAIYRMLTCTAEYKIFYLIYFIVGVLIFMNHTLNLENTRTLRNLKTVFHDFTLEYVPICALVFLIFSNEIITNDTFVIYFGIALAILLLDFYTKNGTLHVLWHIQAAVAFDYLINYSEMQAQTH
jgi:hypothetical protein